MPISITITPLLYKLARITEKIACYAQGKGYGATTIKQENQQVHKLLGNIPKLVVDIGGNIGEYTAEVRRRNPYVEIHTFEPCATNIEKLKLRFANDHRTTILPWAISDKTGTKTLFSDKLGSGLGSLTKRRLDHFNITFDFEESIHTIRFEEYWRNNLASRSLDIVKMDIEGHEFSALNGFGEAIFSTKIIQFEFGGCNIDTRTYFQDFWYFFREHKFDLYRITPFGVEKLKFYKESDEFFTATNYIAVNKNLS